MLYHAYELQRSWLNSASAFASIGVEMLNNPANPFNYVGPMGYMNIGPVAASALDLRVVGVNGNRALSLGSRTRPD